jgi:iron complex outermembrane receptor protein
MHHRHRSIARRIWVLAALVAVAAAPRQSPAQTTELDDVIVTAQRQSERAQDVPIAITALSGADLEARGARQASDVVSSVPNLIFTSPYGEEAQPTFALRGVATNDYSQNQSSPIAMYVDEVYKSVGAEQVLQLYDLDRVEVLRGPQGTLYGKNATGGAVSFYSRNPDLNSYGGYVTAGLGNFHEYSVQGAVGGPLIDHELGWRAAIFYEKRDGWMDSIEPGVRPAEGVDALAGRVSFLAKPSDALSILLKMSASHSGGTPYGSRPFNINPNVTGSDPHLSWFQNAALAAVDKKIDNDSVSLKVDWQLNEHYTLTSVSGYDYGRWYEPGDDGSVGAQIYGLDTYASTVNSASQELRLSSHDNGKLSWLGGLYYDRESVHAWLQYHYFDAYPGSFVNSNGTTLYGFDQANSFDQIKDSKAAFFNANLKITPVVTLTGGVRYTRDKVAVRNFYALEGGLSSAPANPGLYQPDLWTPTIPYVNGVSFVNFTPGLAPTGGTYPELTYDSSNVSFKGGINWTPIDEVLLYASVSRGYRGAAFNGQALNSPLELNFAQPERLTDYEVGAKTELWDKRLQFNTAVFYYDYRNQQFLDTFAGPTGPLFHVINAPKSKVEGAEFELRFKATQELELRGNLGLLDGKYEELSLRATNLSGNQLALSPKTSVSAAIDWKALSMAESDLRLQADTNYYSKIYFDALNTQRIAQAGHAITNARALVEFGSMKQYSVSAWIKNLTDREYMAYAIALRNPADGGLGLDFSTIGEPRTFGITGTVKF